MPRGREQRAGSAAATAAAASRRGLLPDPLVPLPLPGPARQIRVKDGRVLVGEFCCLDKQGNIILQNTFEHMTLNGA